jgi:hypothetical protein
VAATPRHAVVQGTKAAQWTATKFPAARLAVGRVGSHLNNAVPVGRCAAPTRPASSVPRASGPPAGPPGRRAAHGSAPRAIDFGIFSKSQSSPSHRPGVNAKMNKSFLVLFFKKEQELPFEEKQ